MRVPKVAVIGAGNMGRTHAGTYAMMPEADLVGIVDPRMEVATEVATRSATKAFPSLEALVSELNPDVIDVCLPTHLHCEYVLKAAELGKHVICEKPIARSLSDATAMIEACERAGVQLHIGLTLRFSPEAKRARALVHSGAIGQIGTVRTFRGGSFPLGWEDWYASFRRSGSLIADLIIHDVDYLRWCFGEVKRVFAKSLLHREANRMDHVMAILRFENGVIAHVEGSWAYPSGFREQFEIAGSEGIIRHDSAQSVAISSQFRRSMRSGVTVEGVENLDSPLEKDAYYLELEHFLACVDGRADPVVTTHDAWKALQICSAVIESVETGKPVNLN